MSVEIRWHEGEAGGPGVFPPCDNRCRRWAGRAHPHMKTLGLDDDSKDFAIELWCSCGEAIATVLFDMTNKLGPGSVEAGGEEHLVMFLTHTALNHGFDAATDEDWLGRLATPPAE